MKARDLIDLGKYLQKLEKKGCPIEYEFEMTNIGIIEDPTMSLHDSYKRYIDLGGKEIKIHISIPNKIK